VIAAPFSISDMMYRSKILTLAAPNPALDSDSPILTDSAAELMEVFREKSNYEGVVSVYEAMKTRGVTPGAKVPNPTLPAFISNIY
jgi:hypothetical protein